MILTFFIYHIIWIVQNSIWLYYYLSLFRDKHLDPGRCRRWLKDSLTTMYVARHAKSLSRSQLFKTPWTAIFHGPLSIGFSRQKYWNRLPGPPPGDLPDPRYPTHGFVSPALAGGFFTASTTWWITSISILIRRSPDSSDSPGSSDTKASTYNVGDPRSIPELGRSSGEGNGNPFQYSCLENPMTEQHGRL